MELFLQVEELLAFALQHLAHGDARPAAHHVGDVLGRDFLFNHGLSALRVAQLVLDLGDVVLQCLELAVADFGHPSVVAFALGAFGLELQLLHLLLVLLDFVHQGAFGFPLGLVAAFLFLQFGNLFAQQFQLGLVVLALDGLALDFQLFQPALDFVQLLGHGVALHPQFGGGLVHQVDGLVGQETVGDVTVRELHGGNDGIILDAHLVVVLVAFLQSAQDGDAAQRVRFVDHDGLEPSLERLVFLEILLVFVERGGTDAPQFAAGQGRLQDVGGVHGAFALSGAHQRVDFVDEEDDLPVALRHLVDDGLQPFLELAFVFGSGDEGAHVQRIELFVLQVLRHVAPQDAVGQTLDDGRLTRTRFTYQYRIVLRASAQDLQHAADFLVAPDDRVELSAARGLDEVGGIFLQGLVGFFAVLRGDLLAFPQFVDGRGQFLFGHSRVFQNFGGCAVHVQQGLDDGFERDELVARLVSIVLRAGQHFVALPAQVGLSALHAGQRGNLALQHLFHLAAVDPQFLEEEVRDILSDFEDAGQQMFRFDGLLAASLHEVDCLLDGLLCLDGEFVKCHGGSPFYV